MELFEATLSESTVAPRKVGGRWLVTIARPGKGASGTYSEDALRNSGPAAFPPKTKSFFNHDTKRDVRDMVGTFPDGAFWNEEEGELQGFLKPFPRYETILDEAGENVEASIHVQAMKDSAGNIRSLLPNRGNTVDLVSFAGLEGSGLKYQVESLFAAAAVEAQKEGNKVEIEKAIEGVQSDITALTTEFRTFVAEARAELKGEADEAAVEAIVVTRVSEALAAYAVQEAAIDAAGLLPKQAAALKARVLKGENVEEALAEAVAFVEEARKEYTPAQPAPYAGRRGTVVVADESANSAAPASYLVGRWSK
jgi:hypothetical protein